jgi:hypothetical protein
LRSSNTNRYRGYAHDDDNNDDDDDERLKA